MMTFFDCIPCFLRQSLDSVRMVTSDEAIHERLLREVLRALGEMDLRQSPPAMAQRIHRIIRELTGRADPYHAVKERFNRLALDIYPRLKARVEGSADPLETAVRLVIAGNVIDMGVNNHLSGEIPAPVIGAIETGQAARFDAVNVLNSEGYIENLPRDVVIEIPAIADAGGLHPIHVGPLPEAPAAYIRTQTSIQRILTEAYRTRSRKLLLQALLLDPFVDSVREARKLLDEMLALQAAFLPEFN